MALVMGHLERHVASSRLAARHGGGRLLLRAALRVGRPTGAFTRDWRCLSNSNSYVQTSVLTREPSPEVQPQRIVEPDEEQEPHIDVEPSSVSEAEPAPQPQPAPIARCADGM
jgi:hypothetical protein